MALTNIWGNPAGFKVVEIGKYTFQLFFDRVEDLERVLKGGPWLYRNSWMLLQRWRRDWQTNPMVFDQAPMWVQFWGLPTHCKSINLGKKLGETLGPILDVGLFDFSDQESMIVKAKVCVNINNPIKRGANIGNRADGIHWIDFKYEKLPQFCYGCGRNEGNSRNNNFGPWLKASQSGKRVDFAKSQQSTLNDYTQAKSEGLGVNKINSDVLLEKLNSLTVTESMASSPSKDKAASDGNMMEVSSSHCSTWKRQIRASNEVDKEKTKKSNKRARDVELDNESNLVRLPDEVYVRLDRGLANVDWRDLFPNHKLVHLDAGSSDHIPILLRLCDTRRASGSISGSQRPFRFEKMWMNHDDCAFIVNDSWRNSSDGDGPIQKLHLLAARFRDWNKNTFGHVGKKIKELQKKISAHFISPSAGVDMALVKNL
ncbi:cysteine desulfurase mitochondrial-like [Senna tora]|uniref:Cysteine desulfurase mitochondrial-like n=1 Tax=Senna tora TaxID=362788 RepID=A0A834U1C0_9FABA|nr:cysteine desulfurase mitochondrial-like [Senna tora]